MRLRGNIETEGDINALEGVTSLGETHTKELEVLTLGGGNVDTGLKVKNGNFGFGKATLTFESGTQNSSIYLGGQNYNDETPSTLYFTFNGEKYFLVNDDTITNVKKLTGSELFPITDPKDYVQAGNVVAKQQKVIYADDYVDEWTGPDPITGWNEGSSVLKAIKAVNQIGGGTIILSERTYVPIGADFFHPLTFPNIYIKGAKMPYFNGNGTGLVNGSIIQGPFVWIVDGEGLKVSDLGIDSGKTVCDAYFGGVAQEGMVWCKPIDHNPASPYSKNAYAKNIVGLNYSPTSTTHAFLFEGIDGGYAENILTLYGQHGQVIKSKKIVYVSGRAYGHSGENFIIKSDDYALSQDIQVGSLLLDSLEAPEGVTPYVSFPEPTFGLLFDAQTETISTVSVDNIIIKRGGKGLNYKTSNGHNISDIYVGSLQVYNANNVLEYSGNGSIERTNVSFLNAISTFGDIVNTSNTLATRNTIGIIHGASDIENTGRPNSLITSTNGSQLFIGGVYVRDLNLAYNISSDSSIQIADEEIEFITKANNILPFYNKGIKIYEPIVQPNISGYATQYFEQQDGGKWLLTSRNASENYAFNVYTQIGNDYIKHIEFRRNKDVEFYGNVITALKGTGTRPVAVQSDGTLIIDTNTYQIQLPDNAFTHASPPTSTSTGKRGSIWIDPTDQTMYIWYAENMVSRYFADPSF